MRLALNRLQPASSMGRDKRGQRLMSLTAGEIRRGSSGVVLQRRIRAVPQQRLHDGVFAVLGGDHQSRQTVHTACVNRCAGVEQQARRPCVADACTPVIPVCGERRSRPDELTP